MLLFMFAVMWITSNAQDIFTTTEYTDNGKYINKMINPRLFILEKESLDRTSFKITQNKVVLLDGYLTECILLKKEENAIYGIETRKMTVINKLNGIDKHIYLFTTIYDRRDGSLKVSVSLIINNAIGRTYLGKQN
jgi:hypothetical protein